jgi:hypothetical protein
MTCIIDWIGVRSAFEAGLDEIHAHHAQLWEAATEQGLLPEMTFARMLAGTSHELLKDHVSEGRVADLLLSRLVDYEQSPQPYIDKARFFKRTIAAQLASMLLYDVMLGYSKEEQSVVA